MNLSNIKNYAIITLTFALLLQSWRLTNAQHANSTLKNAIAQSQAVYKQEENRQRLMEQEAAISAKQSQQRMDMIMKEAIPSGCQNAINYLIAHNQMELQ